MQLGIVWGAENPQESALCLAGLHAAKSRLFAGGINADSFLQKLAQPGMNHQRIEREILMSDRDWSHAWTEVVKWQLHGEWEAWRRRVRVGRGQVIMILSIHFWSLQLGHPEGGMSCLKFQRRHS